MKALAFLVVLLPLFAGCSQESARSSDVELVFASPMAIETTATEPWEERGYIRIAWRGELMAIDTEMEVDMPRFVIRDGDTIYTSQNRIGWLSYGPEAVFDGLLSNRIQLWDLPRIVAADGVQVSQDADSFRATGTITEAGAAWEFTLDGVIEDGRVVEVVLTSPNGRESPFTFTAGAAPPAVHLAPPTPSRSPSSIQGSEGEARAAHQELITLIEAHERRTGGVPDRVDQETLALELLTTGASWPASPYDDQALANRQAHGHFRWIVCGDQDGRYEGYGWDDILNRRSFGSGCADIE